MTRHLSAHVVLRAVLLLAAVAGGSEIGCVLTPYEAVDEPPRVLPVARLGTFPQSSLGESAEATGPSEIAASHLLVMHRDSLRGSPDITRSKAEARIRAEEALARARAGESFATLVAEYSDEPGAASRGGSLGRFDRRRMVASFSDAAFALKPGQLSGIVETAFGYHVILRTE